MADQKQLDDVPEQTATKSQPKAPAKITKPDSLTDSEFEAALADAKAFDITTDAGIQRYVEKFAADKSANGWRTSPDRAGPKPTPVRCTVHETHPGLWTVTALNADGSPERSLVSRGDVFNWFKGEEALKRAVEAGKVEIIDQEAAKRIMRMTDPTDKDIEMILGPLDDDGDVRPADLPYPKPRAAARL